MKKNTDPDSILLNMSKDELVNMARNLAPVTEVHCSNPFQGYTKSGLRSFIVRAKQSQENRGHGQAIAERLFG